MDPLYQSLKLRSMTLRNRIALAPMCQYSAREGLPNDWHLRHYAERAIGGAGLVVVEATAVGPEGRISPADLGIWDDAHGEALARVAAVIKAGGAVAGIQLAHAGRKASTCAPWDGRGPLAPDRGGWQTLGPSALAFGPGYGAPLALDEAGMAGIVADFVAAAARAVAAGFQFIELHAAHGYLLHQFLSPLSNLRKDGYGGGLEGRLRLPLEVAAALRAALPEDHPLAVRISATDWAPGGWELEGSVALALGLKGLGVDLVDVSTGGLVPYATPSVGPLYQVPFARAVRERAGVVTGCVGLITELSQARSIVAEGGADLVSLGRLLLRDPYWPLRNAPAEQCLPPRQYLRAFFDI